MALALKKRKDMWHANGRPYTALVGTRSFGSRRKNFCHRFKLGVASCPSQPIEAKSSEMFKVFFMF